MDDWTAYCLYLYFIDCLDAVLSKEFLAAIVGGLLAGGFSILSIKSANKYAMEKASTESRAITLNTLNLLMAEINTAWSVYKDEFSEGLKATDIGEPYITVFPLGNNIFPMYDSAPSSLANLSREMAKTLIRTYMRMKGIVAMIEMNNSDTESAHEVARENIQIIANEYVRSGKDYKPEDLDSIYNKYLKHEAAKLNMGGTADALKSLTIEVENLIGKLNELITKEVS